MKSLFIVSFLLIFIFSVTSGISMTCCWDFEAKNPQSEVVELEEDHDSCHKKNEEIKEDFENESENPDNCCYDNIQCQIQVIKLSKALSIEPTKFALLRYSNINNFDSNTLEPPKYPPKALL